MPRNTLTDLNNHLFTQLERLNDDELSKDELDTEIERARAINGVAKNIIENAKTTIQGAKFSAEHLPSQDQLPAMLKSKEPSND